MQDLLAWMQQPPAMENAAPSSTVKQASKRKADCLMEPTEKSVEVIKARMVKKMISAVKKTAHRNKNKPYSEVSEGMDESTARALMGPNATGKSVLKLAFVEDDNMLDWTGLDTLVVHPVNCKGFKTICMVGMKPKLYIWAKMTSLELKYTKNTNMFTMKVRSEAVASGIPDENGQPWGGWGGVGW